MLKYKDVGMKTIESEHKLCLSCMETHVVYTVETLDKNTFKDKDVEFIAVYEFCTNTGEYFETEEMSSKNDLAFKDAYRKAVNLLTSTEIKAIREKLDISQKDFSLILDWGMATITRYENHQVQDRAHDDILRKIDSDPQWFLEMLERAKESLAAKAYLHYRFKAQELFNIEQSKYLAASIYATYANYTDPSINGGTELNLDKVVELINYLAMNVRNIHKVKLMKMMWYSDFLNYKKFGKAITGLVYRALAMGAVPEGYEKIVMLNGVCFDSMIYGENIAYRFKPAEGFEINVLEAAEIETINEIINKIGSMKTNEIVNKMHDEDAYIHSLSNSIIPYTYADKLSLG